MSNEHNNTHQIEKIKDSHHKKVEKLVDQFDLLENKRWELIDKVLTAQIAIIGAFAALGTDSPSPLMISALAFSLLNIILGIWIRFINVESSVWMNLRARDWLQEQEWSQRKILGDTTAENEKADYERLKNELPDLLNPKQESGIPFSFTIEDLLLCFKQTLFISLILYLLSLITPL